jgi:hypothetical protein
VNRSDCPDRHAWLPVPCILDRGHVGPHWGPLTDKSFVEWQGDLARVVTPERAA